MRNTSGMPLSVASFTEKDFYLAEFRGRSIGIAIPPRPPIDLVGLIPVLSDLAGNETRVVLMGVSEAALRACAPRVVVRNQEPAWSGALWRALAYDGRAGLVLPSDGFARHCADVASRLRLAKLVWLDGRGGLRDAAGRRISALALSDVESWGVAREAAIAGEVPVEEIGAMLKAGVTSVSVCRADDLADELFTYAGSGTFFSRERYTDVRALTLDDFDAAAYLIAQGVSEGYLAPRSESEIDRLLSHGFGVFIEGRYLAGIGSLRPYPRDAVGELAGLYTVTRFAGEGVGAHLIRFGIERAQHQGFERVFACTTSERVATFFQRNGFEPVDDAQVPASKWRAYPKERRAGLRCLAHDVLDTRSGAERVAPRLRSAARSAIKE